MTAQTTNPVDALLAYFERTGVRNLSHVPGAWEHQFGTDWRALVNAHDEEVTTADGVPVPPWSLVVLYLGNAAALLNLVTGEGQFVASDKANVRTFIAAIEGDISNG